MGQVTRLGVLWDMLRNILNYQYIYPKLYEKQRIALVFQLKEEKYSVDQF